MHTRRGLTRKLVATAAGAILLLGGLTAGTATASPADPPPAPMCPAAPGNARFVRFLYVRVFERCPSTGEVTYWTGVLNDGASRLWLTWFFFHSDEYLHEFAVGIRNLGRTPDQYDMTHVFDDMALISGQDKLAQPSH